MFEHRLDLKLNNESGSCSSMNILLYKNDITGWGLWCKHRWSISRLVNWRLTNHSLILKCFFVVERLKRLNNSVFLHVHSKSELNCLNVTVLKWTSIFTSPLLISKHKPCPCSYAEKISRVLQDVACNESELDYQGNVHSNYMPSLKCIVNSRMESSVTFSCWY